MAPEVSAAIIGAFAGLAGSIPAILISMRAQKLAERQYEDATRVDIEVRKRVNEMLSHGEWEARSFEAIASILLGLPHDDIRRALIAAGAVSFVSNDGREMWTNKKTARKGRMESQISTHGGTNFGS